MILDLHSDLVFTMCSCVVCHLCASIVQQSHDWVVHIVSRVSSHWHHLHSFNGSNQVSVSFSKRRITCFILTCYTWQTPLAWPAGFARICLAALFAQRKTSLSVAIHSWVFPVIFGKGSILVGFLLLFILFLLMGFCTFLCCNAVLRHRCGVDFKCVFVLGRSGSE